jgi:4-hydroxybenzoate polyprenyltransferase
MSTTKWTFTPFNLIKAFIRGPFDQILFFACTYAIAKATYVLRDEPTDWNFVLSLCLVHLYQVCDVLIADIVDKEFDEKCQDRKYRALAKGDVTMIDNLVLFVILFSICLYLVYLIPFWNYWMFIKVILLYIFYTYAKYFFPDPQFSLFMNNFYESFMMGKMTSYTLAIGIAIWFPDYCLQVFHSGARGRERGKRGAYCAINTYGANNIKWICTIVYIIGLIACLYCLSERFILGNILFTIHYIVSMIRYTYQLFKYCPKYEAGEIDGLPYSMPEHFLSFGLKMIFL